MATHPDTHQSSTRNRISFSDTYMGKQLHLSRQQGNIVQTWSLIRQDVEKNCNRPAVRATPSRCGPYYGNYVKQKCNCLDARATPSRRGPDMRSRGARYGKPVAQLSIQTPQLASGRHLEKTKSVSI
jgi:hypothetical protein